MERFPSSLKPEVVGDLRHPDGTPFSDADYRKAGMPVPTPKQRAHWAEMDRRFPDQDID